MSLRIFTYPSKTAIIIYRQATHSSMILICKPYTEKIFTIIGIASKPLTMCPKLIKRIEPRRIFKRFTPLMIVAVPCLLMCDYAKDALF